MLQPVGQEQLHVQEPFQLVEQEPFRLPELGPFELVDPLGLLAYT